MTTQNEDKINSEASGLEIAVTTGLSAGSNLRSSRRVNITALGAQFDPHMPYTQWLATGRAIHAVKNAHDLIMASWLKFGQKTYGAEKVDAACVQLELTMPEVERSATIALLPESVRRAGLTSEHYYVTGLMVNRGTINVEDADKWLTIAVEESLKADELYHSIEAGQVMKGAARAALPHTNRDGFLTIHGLGTKFTRWFQNLESRTGPVDKLPPSTKQEILTEIQPILDLAKRLGAELV